MLILQMLAIAAIAFSIQAIFSYKTRGIPGIWYQIAQIAFMVLIMVGAYVGLTTFAYDVPALPWLFVIAFLSAMLGMWFGAEFIPMWNAFIAERRLQAFIASQKRDPIMGNTRGTTSHG